MVRIEQGSVEFHASAVISLHVLCVLQMQFCRWFDLCKICWGTREEGGSTRDGEPARDNIYRYSCKWAKVAGGLH